MKFDIDLKERKVISYEKKSFFDFLKIVKGNKKKDKKDKG